MKELGSGTAYNTHNTTSLIRTLKYVSDILQAEEAFTVEEYKHTHTDALVDVSAHDSTVTSTVIFRGRFFDTTTIGRFRSSLPKVSRLQLY